MRPAWRLTTTALGGTVSSARRLYSSHSSSTLAAAPNEEPSLLLRHIHCSIPTVAKLYLDEAQQRRGGQKQGGSSTRDDSLRIPVKDPETAEEGEAALAAFCRELGMGVPAMRRWRSRLQQRFRQRWGEDPGGGAPPTCAIPEAVDARVSLADVVLSSPHPQTTGGSGRGHEAVGEPKGRLYFQPRTQDVQFIRDCGKHLRAVLSPLVTLSPPGTRTAEEAASRVEASPRATTYGETSNLYATRFIPAGMFVMSVPTDAAFFAEPPPTADPILSYFTHIEDLVGQLVAVEEEGAAAMQRWEEEKAPHVGHTTSPSVPPHFGYVQYLKESIVPARNLPFLKERDIGRLLAKDSATDVLAGRPGAERGDGDAATTSPALELWRFFHCEMKGEPLTAFLRERLSKAEYAWWVSAVLSRREGASTLVPLVDKLNHSVLPNCYYTMSSAQSFCCLDVLDNMMAGVSAELLYQPFVHVYTVRDVQPGEELTLCYSSAADGFYKRASGSEREPRRPASLDAGHRAGSHLPGREGLAEAMTALFSSSSGNASSGNGLGPPPRHGRNALLSSLLHPGKQQVDTPEGRASWQMQWGFVPPVDAVYSEADLREMAALVAEKRVNSRKELFPVS